MLKSHVTSRSLLGVGAAKAVDNLY